MDTYEGSIYDPDTLHKYLYANGNPVRYSDLSGNFASAVGGLVATTINTVMNNFQTLNAMGIISGLTNSAITAFLGGSDMEIGEAFFKGYVTGFGLGAVMYVVAAYEIMTIAEMCLIMAGSNTVMSVVLSIVAVNSGNTKAALVYGTLSILSLITFCKLYNANCTIDIIGEKGSCTVEYDNSKPKGTSSKPKSNREKYMGKTPGKNSRTGREVIERMKAEGKIRDGVNGQEFFSEGYQDWFPLEEADMSHIEDCVSWWNEIGRFMGAKSEGVRKFMLESKNYYLEHYHINRSQGGSCGETYLPPEN